MGYRDRGDIFIHNHRRPKPSDSYRFASDMDKKGCTFGMGKDGIAIAMEL
jgi:hypothetical protein